MSFEWRANINGDDEEFHPEDGLLFACHPSACLSQPTLTLVPPPEKAVMAEESPAMMMQTIAPGAGDDVSPPNAVDARKINGVAIPVSATAGWSHSPPKTEGVYPSVVAYDLRLKTNQQKNSTKNDDCSATSINDSLELAVSLEYENPRYENGESMMVKLAIAKTLVQAETGTELALVATQFQEFVPAKNSWIDITANVDYTQTADAVADAVLKDPNTGQTAGKATVTANTIDLTLGPFSAKARLNLTFQAERLYTYEAMSIKADGSDIGSYRLLPLWVNLPFAPIHEEGGSTQVAVRMEAPAGSTVLSLDEFSEAYHHLKQQEDMKRTTILALSELAQRQQVPNKVGYQFQWNSLPPRSSGVLTWLKLPNPVIDNDDSFDFVHIGRSLEEMSEDTTSHVIAHDKTKPQVVVQVPSEQDLSSLQVPLPGHGPMGSLWRLKVKLPEAQPRQQPMWIVNMSLSDKSGSTGIKQRGYSSDAKTMRQRFNELAEVRFLRRLESIPALVQAGVLKMNDVWTDVFLAFDSAAPKTSIRRVMFRIQEVHDTIGEAVQAIRSNQLENSKLPQLVEHVKALRGICPGGLTDFAVGPRTLTHQFGQWQNEAKAKMPQGKMNVTTMESCTFVEFDTDGGHNRGGDYLQSLQSLCEVYDVKNGVVTGFGSWLNQDCASKVARVLGKVPAQLALQVPEPGTEGLDNVFRRGFSAWLSALRQPPSLKVKVSAGSVAFPASFVSTISTRNANAVDILAIRRIRESYQRLPKFGAPDVCNETYTKTVLETAPAGEELLLYVVSRLKNASELVKKLDVEASVEGASEVSRARVWSEEEDSEGHFLAFDWLTMLTTGSDQKGIQPGPIRSCLSSRLEDEVSFRFNLASPSGKTSFLGRCKTVNDRASIDSAHQPGAPQSPLKILPPQAKGKVVASLKMPCARRSYFVGKSLRRDTLAPPGAPPSTRGAPHIAGPPKDAFYSGMSTNNYLAAGSMNAPMLGAMDTGAELLRSCGSLRVSAAPSQLMASAAPLQTMAMQSFDASLRSAAPTTHAQSRQLSSRSHTRRARPSPVPFPQKKQDPSWVDALEVPVGANLPLSNKEYDELMRKSLLELDHARKRLQGDAGISFICDVCNRPFTKYQDRYHCYDCRDFDACSQCQERHKVPFHRIALISSQNQDQGMGTKAAGDVPLLDVLLKPTKISETINDLPVAEAVLVECAPDRDQTMEWTRNRLCRLLLTVRDWWPIFRASFPYCHRLPEDVAPDLISKIHNAIQESKNYKPIKGRYILPNLANTVKIILDSLNRESSIVAQAPHPSSNSDFEYGF